MSDTIKSESLPQLQPWDEHNRKLKSNVAPTDWINPRPNRPYQLVVIGAGTAGLVTAAAAAGLGARVALIERELMGGDCLNVGCVPSKALIASARLAAKIQDSKEFGISINGVSNVGFEQVMQRMRALRAGISPMDSAQRFKEMGVDVFFGQASFVDQTTIRLTDRAESVVEISFKRAVIATGARASAPPIPGLDQVKYLTNETLFSLTSLPARMAVIGAGPIGVEMAQTFARLGSEVYLLDINQRILQREDSDAADVVQQQLLADGVQLKLGSKISNVEPGESQNMQIVGNSNDGDFAIDVNALLVAVGRKPNIEKLNLPAVNVEFDEKGIEVNDFLQTTNHRIYAAGDVCSKYQFTHAADFMARIVVQNGLFAVGPFGRKRFSKLNIPWSTYSTPELAHVGLSEQTASDQGTAIDTYKQSFAEVDRAILDGQPIGFAKIHTRKGTDKILGATIVGQHAGDLICEITLAMNHGIGLSGIGNTIHPYPTTADAIRKLGDQYSRSRLNAFSRKLLALLLRLNAGR